MGKEILTTVVISLGVAAASLTITRSVFFEMFRLWLEKNADKRLGTREGTIFAWAYDLCICPYCTSHWLALLAVIIYNPRLINSEVLLLDIFVQALAVTALATFFGAVIFRAYHVKDTIGSRVSNSDQADQGVRSEEGRS